MKNFILRNNLIRTQLRANSQRTKFIPVYMDALSDLDIPSFLRNNKAFSLPSQMTELVHDIVEEQAYTTSPFIPLEESRSLLKHKKRLEEAIKTLNKKHQKMRKTHNNNGLEEVCTMWQLYYSAENSTRRCPSLL